MRVSQVVYPNEGHSKTHSPITGHHSPFYRGAVTPPFHPQPAASPSPPTIHPAFATPSPVPTLSYGCKCLPIADQASVNSFVVISLPPHTRTVRRPRHPHLQPVRPDPGDTGPGLPGLRLLHRGRELIPTRGPSSPGTRTILRGM